MKENRQTLKFGTEDQGWVAYFPATGWYPKVTVRRGVEILNQWLIQYRNRSFKALAAGGESA